MTLEQLLVDYQILAPLIFIIVRSFAIIFPPIPGIAFDLVGLAIFGWFLGFIYAEIGIMLGATVAFFIARKFREPVIKKVASLRKVHDWEKTLSHKKKFWTIVAIRLPANPLFFDYISYGLGLTKISSPIFFFSTLFSTIPLVLPFFYFGGVALNKGFIFLAFFFIAIIIIWFILKKRKKD